MDERQRRTLFVALALLLVAALVVLVFWRSTPRAIPSTLATHGVCLSCKKSGVQKHAVNQIFPIKCESCGAEAFYGWYFCFDCRHRFVPELVKRPGEPPRYPITISCPKCKNTNVCGIVPQDERQANPAGDLPLPKWPP